MSIAEIVRLAREAREKAHAPYSHFKVGAALECEDGTPITGCNIENATLGLTMCAERVALFKAISEGHRKFRRVCVVTAANRPTPPCGSCRQLLWEFGGNLEILLADQEGLKETHRLADLFPHAFDGSNIT
jgi:cytidine deaminase